MRARWNSDDRGPEVGYEITIAAGRVLAPRRRAEMGNALSVAGIGDLADTGAFGEHNRLATQALNPRRGHAEGSAACPRRHCLKLSPQANTLAADQLAACDQSNSRREAKADNDRGVR